MTRPHRTPLGSYPAARHRSAGLALVGVLLLTVACGSTTTERPPPPRAVPTIESLPLVTASTESDTAVGAWELIEDSPFELPLPAARTTRLCLTVGRNLLGLDHGDEAVIAAGGRRVWVLIERTTLRAWTQTTASDFTVPLMNLPEARWTVIATAVLPEEAGTIEDVMARPQALGVDIATTGGRVYRLPFTGGPDLIARGRFDPVGLSLEVLHEASDPLQRPVRLLDHPAWVTLDAGLAADPDSSFPAPSLVAVYDAALGAEGQTLALAGQDLRGAVEVIRNASSATGTRRVALPDRPTAVAMHPASPLAYAGTVTGEVFEIALGSEEPPRRLQLRRPPTGRIPSGVTSLQVSPDAAWLLVGGVGMLHLVPLIPRDPAPADTPDPKPPVDGRNGGDGDGSGGVREAQIGQTQAIPIRGELPPVATFTPFGNTMVVLDGAGLRLFQPGGPPTLAPPPDPGVFAPPTLSRPAIDPDDDDTDWEALAEAAADRGDWPLVAWILQHQKDTGIDYGAHFAGTHGAVYRGGWVVDTGRARLSHRFTLATRALLYWSTEAAGDNAPACPALPEVPYDPALARPAWLRRAPLLIALHWAHIRHAAETPEDAWTRFSGYLACHRGILTEAPTDDLENQASIAAAKDSLIQWFFDLDWWLPPTVWMKDPTIATMRDALLADGRICCWLAASNPTHWRRSLDSHDDRLREAWSQGWVVPYDGSQTDLGSPLE